MPTKAVPESCTSAASLHLGTLLERLQVVCAEVENVSRFARVDQAALPCIQEYSSHAGADFG